MGAQRKLAIPSGMRAYLKVVSGAVIVRPSGKKVSEKWKGEEKEVEPSAR